ncbi:MAG: T9SS type A sorting domain-containing protein [Saprospiraceae bacterium]|nr:T9SS type A sorting domain-containing protein [Saprospiraceae bacterium]
MLIENSGPLQNGWYHISIKDSIGCITKDSIAAFSKPNGGDDKSVRCYLTGKTTLKAGSSGEWVKDTINPGTFILTHPQSLITGVDSFSAPGTYRVFRSSGICQDTVMIHVGENCTCAVENELTIPEDFSFCSQITDITIEGNEVDVPGTYGWLYSENSGVFIPAPGISNQKNYKTNILHVGEHTFKRVFYPLGTPDCSDTSNTVIILVSPDINAGADSELFCFETDTAFLQASGSGYWKVLPESVGEITLQQYGNPIQAIHSFELPGDYLLSWTNDVCSDTVTIKANPYCGCFEANAGRDTSACAGSDLKLAGSCIVGRWYTVPSNPAGVQILTDTLGNADIRFSASALGEYRFIYVVFDTLVDTIKVVVHSRPNINVGEDFAFCEGSPAVLIVAGGGVGYVWSTLQTTANILVSPAQTTTYHVTGYNQAGCSNTDSITVTILPRPAGSIPSIPMVPEGSNVELNSGIWSDAQQFIWQGPNNFIATEQNPMISNIRKNQEGMYQLTIISPDECMTVSSVQVIVDERVLPLYISKLEAVYDKIYHQNLISWNIESLINHDYIIVERALDGENFIPLEKIFTNETTGRFEISDKEITFNKLYQYRLLSVDIDGQKEYFGPVVVRTNRNEGKELSAKLFPVPATDKVHLQLNPEYEENVHILVYDTDGLLIFDKKVSGGTAGNVLSGFDVHRQAAGSYLVLLQSGMDKLVLPFIISK